MSRKFHFSIREDIIDLLHDSSLINRTGLLDFFDSLFHWESPTGVGGSLSVQVDPVVLQPQVVDPDAPTEVMGAPDPSLVEAADTLTSRVLKRHNIVSMEFHSTKLANFPDLFPNPQLTVTRTNRLTVGSPLVGLSPLAVICIVLISFFLQTGRTFWQKLVVANNPPGRR